MKLQFKSDRLGAEGLIELDLREGIEFTKFILENKEELRELNLEALDHIEEILVKLADKAKKFVELDKEMKGIMMSGVKEIPQEQLQEIVKIIPKELVSEVMNKVNKEEVVPEQKEIVNEEKKEDTINKINKEDIAVLVAKFMNKL